MEFKSYSLNFHGFWLLETIESIPSESGIYCVYGCKYFPKSKTVHIENLIHIGGAMNVCERIKNHKKLPKWHQKAGRGKLCFSFAPVRSEKLVINRIKDAMIFKHEPPHYDKKKFPELKVRTQIQTKGMNAELQNFFTVPY